MAKTKPQDRGRKGKNSSKSNGTSKKSQPSPDALLLQATALLQTSQPEDALVLAQRALALTQTTSEPTAATLPALSLLGEIHVELGDPQAAQESFLAAVSMDPEGTADNGAEKFLWLAQLCEEGGAESVNWFQKGVAALKQEISVLESKGNTPAIMETVTEKKHRMASALCGIAEVYMTDLSWEADAETRCESAVTEALLVAPDSPETLQTLASIRISQLRIDDARAALSRSIELWKDLEIDDSKMPDFPTKISLSRLLMDAEMEEEAIEVLETLVGVNDTSVEAWYLGGWCLHVMSEKQGPSADSKTVVSLKRASRDWLENCLKLCTALEYEDDRLREHAEELTAELNESLGPRVEGEEEQWEETDGETEEDESEDEEMDGT